MSSMGGSGGNQFEEPISEINITPFVDIILVVLIIFMVATPLIMNPSLRIQLPKAASGEESMATQLNIGISANGEVTLNGKATSESELNRASLELIKSHPEIQAIISADRDVSHGKVIGVIDAVKSAGVHKFAISIEKK